MAVIINAGVPNPIKLALTIGVNKTPIDAAPLNRVLMTIHDRDTLAELISLDSNIVNPGVFFWGRTVQTVKGVADIYLLELELHDSGLPIQEDMIARLTTFDGANPLGVPWKQFAINSR